MRFRPRALLLLAALPAVLESGEAERWAFQPIQRPLVPAVLRLDSCRGPIDAFILVRLEARGLEPAPEARRETLIRRVSLDLLGLPPEPDDVEAFVNDPATDAYERFVDRRLASPRLGERWGRHWLDVARFGESHGFEFDHLRDHAWRYRDFVIRSFNADKPYDLFVKEQIAGDVIEPVTHDGIAATGFLVAGPWDEAGNLQQSQVMKARAREEELEDFVGAVAQTFLAVTANCARCHDHKFDPIPQRDYYRLKAALEGVRHGNRLLLTPAEAAERERLLAAEKDRVAALEASSARIERVARERVLRARVERPAAGAVPAGLADLPAPIARWTFDGDARDQVGGLHATLLGNAAIADGRLRLDGKGSFARTEPLRRDLGEKTLEAWLLLPSLEHRGGGVLTVETPDGSVFDSIVYGEREPRKWLPGSDFYRRSRDLDGPPEAARPDEAIHVAITYARDGTTTLYRNGEPYGEAYRPAGPDGKTPAFHAGAARILFGLRHTGAGNGHLAGEIDEARLYDRALAPDEVRSLFRSTAAAVPLDEALAALTSGERARREEIAAAATRARSALAAFPAAPLAYAPVLQDPAPTRVLARGDVQAGGEVISAGGLSAVPAPPDDFGLAPDAPEAARRKRLAEWIASRENPLTPRAIANRLWHYHLGRGIAATPNDFGAQGERPTHPELLDWLAGELIAGDWSLKRLHRSIISSAVYRQSSRHDALAAAADAEDRLLWRFAPRRLEAEAVRDAMLAASGGLSLAAGGPSFRPFTFVVNGSNLYTLKETDEPEFHRRAVYRMSVLSARDPLLDSLDCPEPSMKAPARAVTTTPVQSLGLMNSAFVLRQARDLAARVRQEAGPDPLRGAERCYRITLGRLPAPGEARRAGEFLRQGDLESLCWALLNSSEFLYLP